MPLLFFFMAIWPGLTAQNSEEVVFVLSNRDYYEVPLNGTTEYYKKFIKYEDCKFIIHGWLNNANMAVEQLIKKNFLKCSNVNVITVDWRKESETLNYFRSAWDTQKVGKIVGDKMMELVSAEVCRLNNTHCIGHSLGAHVCGDAASHVQNTWGKNISRITALDPARQLFEYNRGIIYRVNEEDACFVDSIHTSTSNGYVEPNGQADFFPNGGYNQPRCDNYRSVYGICNHYSSFEYFAESICDRKAFLSTLCGSYAEYESGRCEGNPTAHMGEYCSRNASGNYFLKTNSEYPYSKS